MDAVLAFQLAELAAAQTRVEGMKAHNLIVTMTGSGALYAEEAFQAEAVGMSILGQAMLGN